VVGVTTTTFYAGKLHNDHERWAWFRLGPVSSAGIARRARK
jgi:hypothetical protein